MALRLGERTGLAVTTTSAIEGGQGEDGVYVEWQLGCQSVQDGQERGPSANASVIWSEGATVDGLHRTCYAASAEASYTVATMACLSVCEMSKFA